MSVKQYTNSKGESLPKVICAVVEFENKRLKPNIKIVKDSLVNAFDWDESTIFGKDSETNGDNWNNIDNGHYESFYSIFPTCKNSRGQELPEEIQVEIVKERLRQLNCKRGIYRFDFDWDKCKKGGKYWENISINSDYSEPTKSNDTFTQGEIVEVSDNEDFSKKYTDEIYLCFFNGLHWTIGTEANQAAYGWKHCRKIQPLELTLPELLTIAEEVKGTKVKLKS